MAPELARCDLIAQLRTLQTDFDKMRAFAQEVEARGYVALLASTTFAGRAHDLRSRAVRLFNQVAHVLRPVEEARNVRLRLLQTSERLAKLFGDGGATVQALSGTDFEAQSNNPTLRELLCIIDREAFPCSGMSLHDQVLSVASAADGMLHAIPRDGRESAR